jgi:2-keto-4-pentenoate hydratase/2-oxohepta-3-ene-1,7-dioic acid hydratase in catechol pathway
MTYSLSTIMHRNVATPVIEVDGRYYALAEIAPELWEAGSARGLMGLFGDWAKTEAQLGKLAERISKNGPSSTGLIEPAPANDAFMTPLQYPAKVLLAGANYYEHMHIDAKKPDFQKDSGIPVFFMKPPTTSLVGCGKTVRYPVQSSKFDWEIELAVVFGKKVRRVSVEQALDAVAGYAVGIDLSARDWQNNERHPWKFDLFTGKAFDDGCPVGPKIVPARFVDPTNLQLRLQVNGVTRQNANSSDMIWSVAEQVAAISEHITLEPGDILLTGTPAGVGKSSNTFLKVGDRIDAEISGLGTLIVEIIEDTGSKVRA